MSAANSNSERSEIQDRTSPAEVFTTNFADEAARLLSELSAKPPAQIDTAQLGNKLNLDAAKLYPPQRNAESTEKEPLKIDNQEPQTLKWELESKSYVIAKVGDKAGTTIRQRFDGEIEIADSNTSTFFGRSGNMVCTDYTSKPTPTTERYSIADANQTIKILKDGGFERDLTYENGARVTRRYGADGEEISSTFTTARGQKIEIANKNGDEVRYSRQQVTEQQRQRDRAAEDDRTAADQRRLEQIQNGKETNPYMYHGESMTLLGGKHTDDYSLDADKGNRITERPDGTLTIEQKGKGSISYSPVDRTVTVETADEKRVFQLSERFRHKDDDDRRYVFPDGSQLSFARIGTVDAGFVLSAPDHTSVHRFPNIGKEPNRNIMYLSSEKAHWK